MSAKAFCSIAVLLLLLQVSADIDYRKGKSPEFDAAIKICNPIGEVKTYALASGSFDILTLQEATRFASISIQKNPYQVWKSGGLNPSELSSIFIPFANKERVLPPRRFGKILPNAGGDVTARESSVSKEISISSPTYEVLEFNGARKCKFIVGYKMETADSEVHHFDVQDFERISFPIPAIVYVYVFELPKSTYHTQFNLDRSRYLFPDLITSAQIKQAFELDTRTSNRRTIPLPSDFEGRTEV